MGLGHGYPMHGSRALDPAWCVPEGYRWKTRGRVRVRRAARRTQGGLNFHSLPLLALRAQVHYIMDEMLMNGCIVDTNKVGEQRACESHDVTRTSHDL